MIDCGGIGRLESYLESTPIPRFCRFKQSFVEKKLDDVASSISMEFKRPEIHGSLHEAMRIAICVGSRGIDNLEAIVRRVVDEVRSRGAHPVVVPAMGSHAGATAAGQEALLAEYGITESRVHAPVASSMDVVEVGRAKDDTPVYVDKTAFEMDGIILVNRIKPHPSFGGAFESGLIKMGVIGLGKHRGAEACHRLGFGNLAERLTEMFRLILDRANILFGVAILENAYDETLDVRLVPSTQIIDEEPQLLAIAKENMPRLLVEKLDVLIIDRIGKNISGSGADPNITGKFLSEHKEAEFQPPRRIVMLDLTPESEGSAVGMGVADFVTERLYQKFDMTKSYINGITSTLTSTCKLPMVMRNDYFALKGAIRTCNAPDLSAPRIARIRDTLSLGQIEVSEVLLQEMRDHDSTLQLTDLEELRFDKNGNLYDGTFP